MSPLELLKEGITNGNWAFVCQGFAKLTGEHLPEPSVKTVDFRLPKSFGDDMRELVKQYLDIGTDKVETEEETDDEEEEPEEPAPAPAPQPKPEDKFRIVHGQQKSGDKKYSVPVPHEKPSANRFVDDGTLATKEIADSKKFSQVKQPEQRRPESKLVNVTCCKCHRHEKVPPILAPKELAKGEITAYVCNSCIRKGSWQE